MRAQANAEANGCSYALAETIAYQQQVQDQAIVDQQQNVSFSQTVQSPTNSIGSSRRIVKARKPKRTGNKSSDGLTFRADDEASTFSNVSGEESSFTSIPSGELSIPSQVPFLPPISEYAINLVSDGSESNGDVGDVMQHYYEQYGEQAYTLTASANKEDEVSIISTSMSLMDIHRPDDGDELGKKKRGHANFVFDHVGRKIRVENENQVSNSRLERRDQKSRDDAMLNSQGYIPRGNLKDDRNYY